MNERNDAERASTSAAIPPARTAGSWWRLPLLLAAVLAAIVAARSTRFHERGADTHQAAPAPADATGKTVSLIIQFGDDRERQFDAIPWHSGMTVDEMMTAASRLPNGITYGVYGTRERLMVNNIDDTYNEWSGGRNWTYQVNGVPADRSAGVFELQPDDRVLWTFGKER